MPDVDAGRMAPPGTQLVLSNVWEDATVQMRSGSTFTVDPGASVLLGAGASMQALNGSGPAPSVAAGAGAGVGATIGALAGHDLGGTFTVTAAGTPTAGVIATVTFGTALGAAPVSVLFSVTGVTTPGAVATCYPTAVTASGFSISDTAALTAAAVYLVYYQVVAT